MGRKSFEIIAECEMGAFPTSADIVRVGEQIEMARHTRPEVVRATVNPPAIYREKRYTLQTRFVVWATDGAGATQAVEGLLKKAGVPCRIVLPSGRALTEAEVPPPPVPEKPKPTAGMRTAETRRRPRKRQTAKDATQRKRRPI